MSFKTIIIIASLVLSVGLIGAAVVRANKHSNTGSNGAPMNFGSITQAQLKAADGKGSHTCLVAIDGTVYQIDESNLPLWQNGQHTPSNGLAYCGADLSSVIDQAPHGRSVLNILPKVGKLVN